MAGYAQLKFVMKECSKTQIRLTGLKCECVYIMKAKYQMAAVKALVQVDFPMHALSEH